MDSLLMQRRGKPRTFSSAGWQLVGTGLACLDSSSVNYNTTTETTQAGSTLSVPLMHATSLYFTTTHQSLPCASRVCTTLSMMANLNVRMLDARCTHSIV